MINVEELYNKNSQVIKNYTDKISSGARLNESEASEYSKALKLSPLLEKYTKESKDLEFAKSNEKDFDSLFISDLATKQSQLVNEIENMVISFSKEEINEFIIEMRAGAGGEEASLFCKDLFVAYTKYFTENNIKFEIIDISESDTGGFSQLVAEVYSQKAYDLLKNEGGVHRVQRVPRTESSGRIHTSTISVAILPIYKKNTVEINQNDLRIDVYRSSGHGGQSVNTTDSAVRITHLPTGLVVTCQNTKSQIKNKEMALKVLKARLEEIQKNESSQNIQNLRTKQIQNADRSEKIKTYNFLQDRITDHRAKLDFSGINKYLQGEIEEVLIQVNKALLKTEI